MIKIEIPGAKPLKLTKLVLDFNGTIALDGILIKGVKEGIVSLANHLEIHLLTADTFGTVRQQCNSLPLQIEILKTDDHVKEKAAHLCQLGSEQAVAIGNGANDICMLQEAALGILVVGPEGCFGKAVSSADIVVNSIFAAFGLLENPQRIVATIRS